jgi:two-component system, OmpR family, sensor kinase
MSRPHRWRRLTRWTLRARLLAALVALLAAVSVVIGVVSVLSLDSFLLARLDDQLSSAVGRSQDAFATPSEHPRTGDGEGDHKPPPPSLSQPGQAEGTLNVHLTSGTVDESGVLDAAGRTHPLSAAQDSMLAALPVDGKPRTFDLSGSLGQYRLRADRVPDGDVIITGLPLRGLRATVYRLTAVVAFVAAAGLLLAALAGTAILRLTLRPLRRVAATASRVSELPLDRGEVALAVRVPATDTDPHTEVGQVGAALNRMLGHISAALKARQASETRVRQFVADASHELRTPLAAIRGYAELARRCPEQVPVDVRRALARVESEAVRMSDLVADMLLLARLDAGRPVEREPVDLSSLVVDGVSDAHAAGPGHRWTLHLPDQPVTLPADRAELHQVVANLLANARTHTPAGTVVSISLATDPGPEAVLSVVDNGPGISPDLLPEVFERFARGDASRSRAAGSTGLGLAIVAGVVEAHHGRVEVTSEPGRTAFTVRLPIERPDPP